MKYEVISTPQIIDLEIEMDRKLSQGWKPIGGVAMIAANHGNMKYAQAIVKEDSNGE